MYCFEDGVSVVYMMEQFCELKSINLNLSEELVKKYFDEELQLWHTYIHNIGQM